MSLEPWKTKLDPGFQRRVDAMADELARQSANLAAAEYRWLKLLGEFDVIGGWAIGGAKTCAAWLSWACGVTPMAARERVRVAKALRELPKVSAAFEAGQLSYSKVRAITRVADAGNEELLVSYGQSATAAQLERVLRGYRGVTRAEDAKDAAAMFERRSVRYWTDEEGFVHISATLPPDDGALVIAQMERLAESNGETSAPPPAPEGQGVSAETAESGRGDAPLVSDRWDAAPPVEARRADALRMMAETAAANGPKATVGGETHLVVLNAGLAELKSTSADATPTMVKGVSAETLLEAARRTPQIEGVGRISSETARRLSCDATVVALLEDAQGRPLGVGRQSQKVPRWLRRALKRRDGGGCRFPGCTATRFVDAHHIVHWADDGPTDLDNLVLLCRFHHRLVHEVGYSILVEDGVPTAFLRPDGTQVPERPGLRQGDGAVVEQDNARTGLTIDSMTGIPDWDGRTPDYSMAVGVLVDTSARGVSAETPPAASAG